MGKLAISIGYIVPLVVVCWIWLGWRFQLRFRFVALALLPILYFAQWYGMESLEGWPTHHPMPPAFELLASDVREPNPAKEDPGAIDIWIREEGDSRPRAYRLAYDRDLHGKLHAARQRIRQGVRQVGTVGGREQSGSRAGMGSDLELTIEDAPPIILPPKH